MGVLSLQYPDAVWEGCIKAKIGNTELRPLVRDWVVRQTMECAGARPDVAETISASGAFQFPDVWAFTKRRCTDAAGMRAMAGERTSGF